VAKRTIRAEVLKEAWIGDAVLALYLREKILRDDGVVDGAKFGRWTSNQYLALIAEPSETEARIGRAYAQGGLPAAFAWIEEHFLPLLAKVEANRDRRLGLARPPQ